MSDKNNLDTAAELINITFKREKDMKFDIVIGNPPYQRSTGGGNSGGIAIWPNFVDIGRILGKTVCMITPSRWFTGGKGISSEWRNQWLNDPHIKKIVHYSNSSEIFSNVSIVGGVSYFIWDSMFNNNGFVDFNGTPRKLNEFDIFIENMMEHDIFDKLRNRESKSLVDISMHGDSYSLNGHSTASRTANRESDTDIVIYCIGVSKTVHKEYISKNEIDLNKIDGKYSLFVSGVGGNKVVIGEPYTIASASFYKFGSYETEEDALKMAKYFRTKTLRFIAGVTSKNSLYTPASAYRYVPVNIQSIDLSQSIENIDKQLYAKYNLTPDEIKYIESTIPSLA